MNETRAARVVSVGQNHVWIVFDGEALPRTAELRKTKTREMLVPGDVVQAEERADGSAFVRERARRRSVLERRTPGGRTKTMAANIDAIAVAAAFDRPAPNLVMIDELLAFAELNELQAFLVWSKSDLVEPEIAEERLRAYRDAGYDAYVVDAREGRGTAALAERLAGLETLIIGASGVGKSTLFSALGGEAAVGAVSERTGQGKQTTTSGRLFHLPGGGALIDSPGIGEFSLEGIEPAEVVTLWRELAPLTSDCRFADCRHLGEPFCAVRAAVDEGRVAPSRYASFERVARRLSA